MPPQRGGARTRRPAGLLRSEEHTSELQSPCNLVCRIIIAKEHTSELQSPCNLVCRLLLEKKNLNLFLQLVLRLVVLGLGGHAMARDGARPADTRRVSQQLY